MRILEGLKAWLADIEWNDLETSVNEERQSSSTPFGYQVGDDYECDGYFDIAEKTGLFQLFLYPKIKIPVPQMDAAHELVNAFNLRSSVGGFHLLVDDRRIRFHAAIDVENAAFSPPLIHNLMTAADVHLKDKLPRLMAVCFGGMTVDQAMEMEVATE